MLSIVAFSRFFIFFFSCYGDHRDLHSFPTRPLFRSAVPRARACRRNGSCACAGRSSRIGAEPRAPDRPGRCDAPRAERSRRSEEHTSELQSQSNLVCRLLLEKKKKKKQLWMTKQSIS